MPVLSPFRIADDRLAARPGRRDRKPAAGLLRPGVMAIWLLVPTIADLTALFGVRRVDRRGSNPSR